MAKKKKPDLDKKEADAEFRVFLARAPVSHLARMAADVRSAMSAAFDERHSDLSYDEMYEYFQHRKRRLKLLRRQIELRLNQQYQ